MIVSWNWLKEYLSDTDLSPEKAAELLGGHAFEIEEYEEKDGDVVIDVDVLPNRSSDCLSMRGVARELASITGIPLTHDPLASTPELTETELIDVKIEDENACPRFTASLITGVEIKESPEWLKERLKAIGQRPINNIVDATNYVMFAIGQPLHAYDADLFPQVDGKWQFGVRFAKEGEVVALIAEGGKDKDQNEERNVELQGTELLIVDRSSDTPIGLAGVKGGRFAGVHEGTNKIIIEAAHFHPTITRKTARRLGIIIDASKRFENEPSRELPPFGQAEIIKLILDIAGGEYKGTIDKYLERVERKTVTVSVEKANALLGLSLSGEEMLAILKRTGSEATLDGGMLSATGPWERTDLTIDVDFIEEIGRLYGYEHVESVVPETVPLKELNKRHYYSEKIRNILMAEGFSEVITSSFRKKDQIQLRNALASDKSFLRSSLIKNITEVLDKNAAHTDLLGADDTRVFEIGTVFTEGGDLGVSEHVALTLGVRLKPSGYTGKEDKLLSELTTKLVEQLGVSIEWTTEKGVAECDLSAVLNNLSDPDIYEPVPVAAEIAYKPFSLYPAMSRDIAMWVGEGTTAEEIETILNEHAGPLRVRTRLFDEFTKDGRTSYAFRLVFQSNEKTLTDEEVNAVMGNVYAAVAAKDWEVR